MIRALFHHPCSPWLGACLAAYEGADLRIDVLAGADDPDGLLAQTQVLLHVLHPVTEAMMQAAPRLRLIQKIGVGLDAIDRVAARRRGIAVCNMPGTNTQAVVEMTLGLMLSVLRGIPGLDQRLRVGGDWALPLSAQASFGEIAGRVVGLVGHGAVARRLEPVLGALGAEVLVCTRAGSGDRRHVGKDELLRRADIVSLHIPETPETRHWLDAAALARMKPGAIVINTARGGLIDEAALVGALGSGHLAGAGLDVFADEPLARDAAILSAPNLVTLPHLAWLTRETLERSLAMAHDNICRLAEGRALLHRCA